MMKNETQDQKQLSRDLSQLRNDELHGELKNRVEEERRLTHKILRLILEVDRRKLFLPMAYSSLFDYLVNLIGYSPASAQRRIDAARLLQQVPELGSQIEKGRLKLTQISQVQQALREVKKSDNTLLLPREKQELLAKLEFKTGPQTELILAQEFNVTPQTRIKQRVQRDESVRLELTLSKEQNEILEQAKALLAHAMPGASVTEVIVSLAARYVKQRAGIPQKRVSPQSSAQSTSAAEVTPQESSEPTHPRSTRLANQPVPSGVKRSILNQSRSCEFRDPSTGKTCGGHYFVEIDHIKARYAGGSNDLQNLRVLCGAHNKIRYIAGC